MGGGECLGNGMIKFPGAPREVREAWNLYMGDPEGWAGPYGGGEAGISTEISLATSSSLLLRALTPVLGVPISVTAPTV